MRTLGELMALRPLKKEQHAGAPRYVKGQHYARMLDSESGVVSFVDVGGAICIVPVVYRDDAWHHMGGSVRVSQHTMESYVISPSTFILSEKMLEAIDAAVERYNQRRAK